MTSARGITKPGNLHNTDHPYASTLGMVEWYIKTWMYIRGRLFQHVKENGMRKYPPSCWRTQHQSMRSQAGYLPAQCSEDSYVFFEVCSLELSRIRSSPMTNYMRDLVKQPHDIQHDACQHLKVAKDRIKAHCDLTANSTRFLEGD